jgi:chromate transporter
LHATIGITIALLSLSGINELFLLMVGGLVVLVPHLIGRTTIAILLSGLSSITISAYTTTIATTAIVPVTMTRLTLFFLKVGSVLFGSGYVLLAFLRGDLVQRWGWLTDQQLLDAITIGQITPGPVFTTATFLGYLLGGWSGAILATIGIFMPGFIFVTLTQPLIPRLRTSAIASHLLDGVVVSSLGLMGAVTYHLSLSSIVDIPTALIATVAAILLVIWQPNSTWLLIGGAMAGWLLKSDLG